MPGLTIGLAFAAAAFAKLQREGLDDADMAQRYTRVLDARADGKDVGATTAAR